MIKIFMDTADLVEMRNGASDPTIAGWTTNPTLMRRAGVTDYRAFAREALAIAGDRPVSFEVTSDDFAEMERQAREIASWGSSAFVKIPVTNSRGDSSASLLSGLSAAGVPLNVTAVFTIQQVIDVGRALHQGVGPAVTSVFVGRIADTGVDPARHALTCRVLLDSTCQRAEILWASPRQAYDVVLAEEAGYDIITMTPDLLAKRALRGRDLAEYSRETVEMFLRDAVAAGYEV